MCLLFIHPRDSKIEWGHYWVFGRFGILSQPTFSLQSKTFTKSVSLNPLEGRFIETDILRPGVYVCRMVSINLPSDGFQIYTASEYGLSKNDEAWLKRANSANRAPCFSVSYLDLATVFKTYLGTTVYQEGHFLKCFAPKFTISERLPSDTLDTVRLV